MPQTWSLLLGILLTTSSYQPLCSVTSQRLSSVLVAALAVFLAPIGIDAEVLQVIVVARGGPRKYMKPSDPRQGLTGPPMLPYGYKMMEDFGRELRFRYLAPGAENPVKNLTR